MKQVIVDKMKKRYAEKGESIEDELFDRITHEVAAGAMKYALLSCSNHVQINFDVAKVGPPSTLNPSCYYYSGQPPDITQYCPMVLKKSNHVL